ncbi:hypothetical protein BTO05_11010 [Winogradskyella sp. PC-19]|uniref:efflux RND transporter periplasmic adaptor subunit n=1 Tax=Winogradskyella sp. PC-19 TaxID=754417 RepID=UPI000B3CEFF2|nr:efflux RND transporter periplasmic adaptor subunit [Winogradskyella sp. PC-19]ARV10140.1 hypothetical protein BTO05_11010 [Winogradskyella sp. PC-19]
MKSKIKFLFIFTLFFNCNPPKEKDKQDLESVSNTYSEGITVSVNVVKSIPFKKQIISNGNIEALQKTELRFKTSERISSIKVKNGQKVNKGQTLAILDNAMLSNQMRKAKIEVDKAKSKLQEEKINYGVGKSNDESIDATILKNLKIKSGLFEAENALENAQLLYSQTIIRAPFSGIIASIETKTGDFITSSDVFCTLINSKNLEVVFNVLENELQFLSKSQEVSIIPFADTANKYVGSITEINPLVDENGLIQVKAKIKGSDNSLFDGTNVKVTSSKSIDDVIVIPKEALVLRSNREVVFTYQDGVAKWNYVKILDENSNSYALREGVKIGDTIIVSGNMNLAHDARVKLNNANN